MRRAAAVVIALALSCGCGAGPPKPDAAPILVSAAVSLADALAEVARVFEAQGGARVVLNLGSSNRLAQQILEGAPADLFVSADDRQMARVEQAGRLRPGTRVALLSNQLVVIVPDDHAGVVTAIPDLARAEVRRVAIGDPAGVPAGVYAQAFLQRAGLWSAIEPKIVRSASVRAALVAAEGGDVDAAIVYRTDARVARRVRIACEFPADPELPIVYPAAILRDAAHPGVERLLAFLQSAPARAVFRRHGFVALEGSPAPDGSR